METTEAFTPLLERPVDAAERRARALERLDEVLTLQAELEAQPPEARPVPITLMRRVVFALYREAVDAGVAREASAALEGATNRPAGR